MPSLQAKLTFSVFPLVPLLLGAVALVAVELTSSGWAEPTRQLMLAAERSNLNRLARLKTEFAGEEFRQSLRPLW